MLESEEQITQALDLAGEELTFPSGSLRGIPGEIVYNIPAYDSPWDIDKQDFDFRVSRDGFKQANLEINQIFTYLLLDETYSFKLTSYTNDLTGWLQLNCSFIEVI